MKLTKINNHFFPELEKVNQSYFYLHGEINHESTAPIMQEIIAANMEKTLLDNLDDVDPEDDIPEVDDVLNILICSGGGEVAPAMSLIAVMQASEIPIRTIALGECGSAALMILMAGEQRVATHHSSLLSHQFWSGMEGSFSSIKATMTEFNNYHEKILKFYVERTGLNRQTVEKHLLKDTDTWLTPDEALKFNVIDLVSDLK